MTLIQKKIILLVMEKYCNWCSFSFSLMLVIQSCCWFVVFLLTLMFLCRYKDVVECERIVVKAFKTPHEVASFRAAKLSDDFYQMKADFERRKTMTMVKDDITRDPTRDLLGGKCGWNRGGWGINNLDIFYFVCKI